MITSTTFAAMVVGSVTLLAFVFAWVVRSLRGGVGTSPAAVSEVNQ